MRILHAPVNVAGIGGFLSSYQRSQGYVSDFMVFKDENPFCKNHDYCLHLDRLTGKQKKIALWRNFFYCLFNYEIFHFYFGITLLPNSFDLRILRFFNKKILMTCCGSDFRLIEVERKRNPYAYLLTIELNDPRYDERKKKLLRYQSRWVHCFLAPRNLYASVSSIVKPEQINSELWIHNLSFDSSCIVSEADISTRKIPVIVHLPSKRKIKGSDYVQNAINNIKATGVKFEYREITGVSHDAALKIIRESDIVIDQMLLGGIGSTAFEAMGFGKPVVSYIIEEVRKEFYPDCPVFNANIDNLSERLVSIIVNPKLRVQLGKQGVRFVRNNLDKKKINDGMISIYQELMK